MVALARNPNFAPSPLLQPNARVLDSPSLVEEVWIDGLALPSRATERPGYSEMKLLAQRIVISMTSAIALHSRGG